DGSTWMVSEDWKMNSGLVNDILFTKATTQQEMVSKLQKCFTNEPVFLKVVESIQGM
ncbi:hypothetical protein BDR06DRAFT_839216, partial [Suillus hirtellus]